MTNFAAVRRIARGKHKGKAEGYDKTTDRRKKGAPPL